MTKKFLVPALGLVLLAGCASPYADAMKTMSANCQSGNAVACNAIPSLAQADAQWHQAQAAEAAAFGVAMLGAAAAINASRPVYVPPPVYVAPPVYARPPMPVHCTSMGMGPGMVSTNCF